MHILVLSFFEVKLIHFPEQFRGSLYWCNYYSKSISARICEQQFSKKKVQVRCLKRNIFIFKPDAMLALRSAQSSNLFILKILIKTNRRFVMRLYKTLYIFTRGSLKNSKNYYPKGLTMAVILKPFFVKHLTFILTK